MRRPNLHVLPSLKGEKWKHPHVLFRQYAMLFSEYFGKKLRHCWTSLVKLWNKRKKMQFWENKVGSSIRKKGQKLAFCGLLTLPKRSRSRLTKSPATTKCNGKPSPFSLSSLNNKWPAMHFPYLYEHSTKFLSVKVRNSSPGHSWSSTLREM